MSQSLINNVSKLKSLVLSGTIGATGPIGPQGERGNALDVNYFGINLSHLDIESDLFTDNIKQFSESSAYEIKVNVPLEILDIYLGFYEEEKIEVLS